MGSAGSESGTVSGAVTTAGARRHAREQSGKAALAIVAATEGSRCVWQPGQQGHVIDRVMQGDSEAERVVLRAFGGAQQNLVRGSQIFLVGHR